MPTVLRSGRYRFYFFSSDEGEPPHVHVKAGGDQAKFGSILSGWPPIMVSGHMN